jgi:hypothetical protein
MMTILSYITFTSSSCCDVLSNSWLKFLKLVELCSCLCSKSMNETIILSQHNLFIDKIIAYPTTFHRLTDLLHFDQLVIDNFIINHLHILKTIRYNLQYLLVVEIQVHWFDKALPRSS